MIPKYLRCCDHGGHNSRIVYTTLHCGETSSFVPVEPSPKMDNEAGFGISRSSDAKQFHITYVCMVLDETINICTDQGSVATSAHEERCGPV
jgi:hypothetical protein